MALAKMWVQLAGLSGDSFQRGYQTTVLSDVGKFAPLKDNRLWTWLQCAQLGYLQPSNANDPEPPPVTARSKQLTVDSFLSNCDAVFPDAPFRATTLESDFNKKYGGVTPWNANVSNILYLKYNDDPWWGLQPNTTESSNLKISLASDNSCAHCGMGCSESMQSESETAMHLFLGGVLHGERKAGVIGDAMQPFQDDQDLHANALQPKVV